VGYTRKQVEKFTGIPARRIQFYTESGLLALENPHPGKGKGRQYSKKDIFRLLIIGELGKHKIELSHIKKIVDDYPRELGKKALEIFDPSTYEVEKPQKNYIIIYDQNTIHYGVRGPFKPLKKKLPPVPKSAGDDFEASIERLAGIYDKLFEEISSSIQIREEFPSVLILNVTYLAEKLKKL
jgi:DNA-binding transcriptional MerR regulator